MAERPWRLLLSCEHGGNRVPDRWRHLFTGREEVLVSHRGHDLGMAPFARRLADELGVPLHLAEVTRLLVELNRSPGHPELFSEFSRDLDREERELILECYYHPYRDAVLGQLDQSVANRERTVHLSLHSFTPELNGVVRNADIGLLYDPRRRREKSFCLAWRSNLERCGGGWRIRRNYPYRGAADSLVTCLRRRYAAEQYVGLELELNQIWPQQGGASWETLQNQVAATLQATLVTWREDDG